MNFSIRLAVGVVVAGVAALAMVWIWTLLERWLRKDPAEVERRRRLDVHRRGRITTGRVVDLVERGEGKARTRLVVYQYDVWGVTYEAAQDITTLESVLSVADCLAGKTACIKYEQKTPGNSIIACEEWCGISGLSRSEQRRALAPLNGKSALAD